VNSTWAIGMTAVSLSAGAGFAACAADDTPGPEAAGEAAAVQAVSPLVVVGRPAKGVSISPSGSAQYGVGAADIASLPSGPTTPLTDVLTQFPSVAIDQNEQIHIRDTEGPQFQYQVNGVLVPLDINTNPPFLSLLSPLMIKRLDLTVGVLPARYGYATGGVVDIETKDGCDTPGGEASLRAGMLETLEPSFQYGGCSGRLGYELSALYSQSQSAFSSATPGPVPIHDWTNRGQGFGNFTYDLSDKARLSLILSGAASNNELPNVPDLEPAFVVAGRAPPPSAEINSSLNFRDVLAILALNAQPSDDSSYQLAYAAHAIWQMFKPDKVGELAYQGVASTASHHDVDNTLEGDATWTRGAHALSAGFYAGLYRVIATDTSLVFPVDSVTGEPSDTPITVATAAKADNVLAGVYVNDLWRATSRLRINLGLRWDVVTGFTKGNQLDPTVNLMWLATPSTTLHAGFARYFQVPSYQGVSPSAPAAFADTTAAGSPGVVTPTTEDDAEWDAGVVKRLGSRLTLSADGYFELTRNYLDTGQFGVVPIFAPFNYAHGRLWGAELSADYRTGGFAAYASLSLGNNVQKGVATGQFNFDPDELAFIDSHYIVLDHQPLVGGSAGVSYRLGAWSLSADLIASNGLRAGFADLEQLAPVFRVDLGVERRVHIPGLGDVADRITVINASDRVNLIRPAEGIGIFQSAYGPRFGVFNSLTLPL
jgi:hypothetical protein